MSIADLGNTISGRTGFIASAGGRDPEAQAFANSIVAMGAACYGKQVEAHQHHTPQPNGRGSFER